MTGTIGLIAVLLISVLFIILETTKFKMHPFLVLLLASYLAGALAGLPATEIVILQITGVVSYACSSVF